MLPLDSLRNKRSLGSISSTYFKVNCAGRISDYNLASPKRTEVERWLEQRLTSCSWPPRSGPPVQHWPRSFRRVHIFGTPQDLSIWGANHSRVSRPHSSEESRTSRGGSLKMSERYVSWKQNSSATIISTRFPPLRAYATWR